MFEQLSVRPARSSGTGWRHLWRAVCAISRTGACWEPSARPCARLPAIRLWSSACWICERAAARSIGGSRCRRSATTSGTAARTPYASAKPHLTELDALFDRDYPLISGINLFFAAAVMIINLLVDVLYAYLDPRCC